MTDLFVIPQNPGTSITLIGEETVRPPASIASTVAVIGSHDWGPMREPTTIRNFSEFEAIFGNTKTDLRDAVLGALVGSGVDGEAAAGEVLLFRAGVSGTSAPATSTINNTTPVTALTLTARSHGTRGNRLKRTIGPDPASPGGKDLLQIKLDDVTIERYSYNRTNITALAALINSRPSKYVTAVANVSGVALNTGTSAFANGNDGTPLTVTEYTQALNAFEFLPFSLLAPANLTNTSIMASILAWVQTQAEEMRPLEVIFGGAAGESLDDASLRTAPLADPHVISLGAGTFHDDFLDADVGTAKLVGRIAGILAGRGEKRALTYAPLAGLSIVGDVAVPTDRLREAADSGVTVFRLASHPDAELIVANGVTTFIATDDAARPLSIFSEPRLVRIIDLFIRRMKEWGDTEIVSLPNSEPTRAAVQERGDAELRRLADDNLIVDTAEDPYKFKVLPTDPERPDALRFEFGWRFVHTTNYLVGVGRIR